MANIKAPNSQYNGETGGVHFVGGIGTTDDKKMIQWFKAHGYEVIPDATEEDLPVPETKVEAETEENLTESEVEMTDSDENLTETEEKEPKKRGRKKTE